jgi:hypothetical protein
MSHKNQFEKMAEKEKVEQRTEGKNKKQIAR